MPGPIRRLAAVALVCALPLALACPLPARAADGAVAWPTFFRLGPGKQYRVLAELSRGTVLELVACDDQWCQARLDRVVGYVERTTLDPGTLATSRPESAQGCFDSTRAGYGRGEAFRYCPR